MSQPAAIAAIRINAVNGKIRCFFGGRIGLIADMAALPVRRLKTLSPWKFQRDKQSRMTVTSLNILEQISRSSYGKNCSKVLKPPPRNRNNEILEWWKDGVSKSEIKFILIFNFSNE